MKPGVLLTDAHARSAVASGECLARHGYRVGAATSDPPAPGQWSRRVGSRFRLRDPREHPRSFAEEVAEATRRGRFATVLPGSDASVLALSNHREALGEGLRLGLPPREVVDRCVNKVTMLEDAAAVGLASPRSVACGDVEEARATAAELGYPVLLKPRQTVFDDAGGLRQRQTFIAGDEASLLGALPEFGLPCLLQRFERGKVVSIAGVAAGDRLMAVAFSRYERTWPPLAGPVSASCTAAPPNELARNVSALIARLGWQGIFELELIEKPEGGFAAIDFNPRLYGSMALATRAGAPIPAVWCDWLLRGEVSECVARPGVHYRWEEAEVRNTLHCLRAGRIRDALSIARPRRSHARAYFRWSDPGPAAGMFLRLVKSRLADRRLAKAERRAAAEAAAAGSSPGAP
jgi:predicted ATP-grasp superfamily ATP-dependent carboligase